MKMRVKKVLQSARMVSKLIRYKLTRQRVPLVVNLLLTNRCNLKCFYCYPQVFNRNLKDISLDKWIMAIDQFHDMGTEIMVLLGGEPFLYKEIDKIVDRIKQHGMICELITNGYFIQDKIDIVKKVDSICLSIDGDKTTNDRNRGNGSYDRVVKAIDIVKPLGVKTRIKAVITRRNMESMDYLCRFALQHNTPLTFTLPSIHTENEDLTISPAEVRKVIETAKKHKKEGCPIAHTVTCLDCVLRWPYDYYEWIALSNRSHSKSILPCIRNDLSCYVDADGMMYPCAILWSNFRGKNIFEVGIKEAWDSLRKKPCYTCGYIGEVDLNLLFSLSLRNIIETSSYLFKRQP